MKKQTNNETNQPKQRLSLFTIMLVVLLITSIFNLVVNSVISSRQEQILYSQFVRLVETDNVEYAQIEDEAIRIVLKKEINTEEVKEILGNEANAVRNPKGGSTYYTGIIDNPGLINLLDEYKVNYQRPILKNSPIFDFISSWIIPSLIFYFIFSWISKSIMKRNGMDKTSGSGGMFAMGKSKAKEFVHDDKTNVKFSDVAGQDEAKESLTEMVDYLHYPDKYKKIGAKQPKGALLVGPPGTGKTMLAKAVAGEAGVPFFSITGSEFVEMFVGVGASRVRDLFKVAKEQAPCIIFIDEIDAIGKSRDNQLSSNDEREQTLNQLLAEMDGFGAQDGIIVLAATNRPEVLDKALLRPGRFDRRIIVERPDLPGREAILHVHAKNVKTAANIDLKQIALATSGATGADLASMINEAAILAVKHNRNAVEQSDLMEAVEVVIAGKELKDRIMNPKERRMVAYHEVGHALVSALQKNSQPVTKITIVPRTMGSLGYTLNVPEEERYLMTKKELLAQIRVLMGGRAAEIVEFNEITTGASNDIDRATGLARSMVAQYGMSDAFGPMGLDSVQNKYLDGRTQSNVSAETNTKIDIEVQKILLQCQSDAIKIIQDHQSSLTLISEHLLKEENISGEEFMALLNQERSQI